MKGIDIVIPIYNAFEELVLCLNSVRKYTDLKKNRVLLINDKSSDRRIKPFLEQQKDMIFIDNEKNLGFSANVNKGIDYSTDRDLLLLNSDTIVTARWLEKIVKCAYSNPTIGTVTPLSNNATICSVPNFCEDNEIPSGLTIDEFADIVEWCSLKKYPQIPVAVGFCMFIKREVINVVGKFDARTFGKGYGEENDFCFRAEQLGYIHAMCDDTFIYHSGSMSFVKKEKKKMLEEHDKILWSRYPLQNEKVARYCQIERESLMRKNIREQVKLHGKRNLLYFSHASFSTTIGGTQSHIQDLIEGLVQKYNIFFMYREDKYINLDIIFENNQMKFKYLIGEDDAFYRFSNYNLKKIISSILNMYKINVVHVHHTYSLSMDIFDEAHRLEIPIFYSIHDYFCICPSLKLLDDENEVCISDDNKNCSTCLSRRLGIIENINYLDKWRAEYRRALEYCEKVFVPNISVLDNIGQHYPEIISKVKVIEHGSDLVMRQTERRIIVTQSFKCYVEKTWGAKSSYIKGWAYLENEDNSKNRIFVEIEDMLGKKKQFAAQVSDRVDVATLKNDNRYLHSGFKVYIPQNIFAEGDITIRVLIERNGLWRTNGEYDIIENYVPEINKNNFKIAFVGGMNVEKGSQIACNLIKKLSKEIEWYVFGGIGDRDLLYLQQDNLTKIGWYGKNELPDLLKQYNIDLVCILSIWPETFCYTLSETILAGIPVIVTDIGALGERVKRLGVGWTISLENVYEEIENLLDNLMKNGRMEYKEKLRVVKNTKIKNKTEMIKEYEEEYNNVINIKREWGEFDVKLVQKGIINEQEGLVCDEEYLKELERELAEIKSTTSYKACLVLSRARIPFKKHILSIMYKIYKFAFKRKKFSQ